MVTSPPDPQFLPATNNPQPNTELIRDALLRGESVPEADFVRGRHLRLYDPTGSLLLSGSSLLGPPGSLCSSDFGARCFTHCPPFGAEMEKAGARPRRLAGIELSS